jgi:hypothetical protein
VTLAAIGGGGGGGGGVPSSSPAELDSPPVSSLGGWEVIFMAIMVDSFG